MPEHLPVILVAENIRSLHNVGALFRSADAVNLERLILAGLTATPPRHEIAKTALGATETVPWDYVRELGEKLAELRRQGYVLVALEQTDRSTDLYETDLPFPLALIVGHERMGVTPETLAQCDHHVHLPMRGRSAHSLNVSAAATAALYELLRRRRS